MNVLFIWELFEVFLPSLRMGYIVLPAHLLKTYKEFGGMFKQTVSTMQQLTFATFIQSGDWERHINRSRTLYKRKHISLIKSITNEMGNNVHILGEQSGLHIVLHVHNGMNERELIHAAAKQRIKLYPLSTYDSVHNVREESYVLLGFGSIPEDCIETVVKLLKKRGSLNKNSSTQVILTWSYFMYYFSDLIALPGRLTPVVSVE